MKKIISYAKACLLGLLLCTCSQAEDDIHTPAETVPPTEVKPVPVAVSVSAESCNQLSFFAFPKEGKRMHRILERVEGQWETGLEWKEIGEEAIFSAFSPIIESDAESETFTYTVSVNQQEEANLTASDLLFASASAKADEVVKLHLSSLMSRLTLTVRSDDGSYSDAELASARVSVRSHKSISVRVKDGKVEEVLPEVASVVPFRNENGTCEAVLCPQSVEEFREGWITVLVAGDTHVLGAPMEIDGIPFVELGQGKETFLSLNVQRKQTPEPEPEPKPEVEWANKTVWVYGVKQPSEADWGYVSDTRQKGLTWEEGCGWFDCNKLNMAGDPDGNLCWAAAASNMICWWLEQNAAYVSRYGKYAGPSGYASSTSCAVFDYFKKYFPNEGGQTLFGLNWFFSGRLQKPGSGNLFPDVFDLVGDGMGYVTADDFNDRIKQALTTKEAISFCVRMMGGYHEMSIWGADFDENGRISAIYITDSNDLSQEQITPSTSSDGRHFIPVGMVRHPVAYKVSASDGGKIMAYMEGSQEGSFTIKVEELHFLGLMEDAWERYFSSSGLN